MKDATLQLKAKSGEKFAIYARQQSAKLRLREQSTVDFEAESVMEESHSAFVYS